MTSPSTHRTTRRATRAILALAAGLIALLPLGGTVLAADGLTLRTPYPAVVVAPGAQVSFSVDVSTTTAARVGLSLSGAPAGWDASIHGGGFVVDAIQTDGEDSTTVRVDVAVPPDATGTARMTLTGTTATDTVALGLEVRVDAEASGDVTLTTDFPSLRGPSSQTFNFNLTLRNETAEDLTFAVNAQGPAGWTIEARLTGQAQAASAIVKAGSSSAVTVSATPPDGVAAGSYPIDVVATAGARTITGSLAVEVTGSYELTLSTPDGRLNGHGSAGTSTDMALVVSNEGTGSLETVTLTASAPTGWEVTFDPETVAALAAGTSQDVTAKIVPSGDAVAGDYVVTFRVSGDQATSDSVEVRFTVETSLQWAVVGGALIVAVVAGLWWVFQRYGRR